MDKEQLESLEKTLIAAINADTENADDEVYACIGSKTLLALCEALLLVRGEINAKEEQLWFFS